VISEGSEEEIVIEPKPRKIRKPTQVVARGDYAYVKQDENSNWKVHDVDNLGFVIL